MSYKTHDAPSHTTLKYVDKKGHTKKAILPKKIENYLLVSYSKQDLFILPAAGANKGLPEIYDRTGNLIVFAIKSANYLITATGGSGTIEHFIATKIRIVKNTQLLANINAVKKEIFYEQIDLVTNNSKKLSYEVIEASNFKIKNNIKYVDVEEITSKTAKKFSDYLNQRDLSNLGFKGIQVARKVLKVLDFIEMTETIKSILPKDNSSTLNIPNPAGVIGAFSSFASVAAYPIAALFFTADIVATEMVKGLMNDIKEDGKLFLAQAKLKGLAAVKQYLKSDSAKICGYELRENFPQETHNKLMKGNISTFEKLLDSKDENFNFDNKTEKSYTYIIQKVETTSNIKYNYVIESIIIQS